MRRMVSTIEKLNLEAIEQSPVLRIAGASLTVGGLVGAGVILIGAFCVSWLITRALRRVRERAERSRQALYLLERLSGYAVIILGVMAALSTAGLNLSSLARLRRRPGHLLADGRQADVLSSTRPLDRNGAGSPGRR